MKRSLWLNIVFDLVLGVGVLAWDAARWHATFLDVLVAIACAGIVANGLGGLGQAMKAYSLSRERPDV